MTLISSRVLQCSVSFRLPKVSYSSVPDALDWLACDVDFLVRCWHNNNTDIEERRNHPQQTTRYKNPSSVSCFRCTIRRPIVYRFLLPRQKWTKNTTDPRELPKRNTEYLIEPTRIMERYIPVSRVCEVQLWSEGINGNVFKDATTLLILYGFLLFLFLIYFPLKWSSINRKLVRGLGREILERWTSRHGILTGSSLLLPSISTQQPISLSKQARKKVKEKEGSNLFSLCVRQTQSKRIIEVPKWNENRV